MKAITQESITLWGRLMTVGGKALLLIWAFLSPIAGVMLAVGLFIGLDTVVGVWSAKRGGKQITSRKMGRVISKMLVYQLCVITFFVMDKFILGDVAKMFISFDFVVTKIVATVLISIEAYSIDESFKNATGKGLIERLTGLIKHYKDIKKTDSE